MTDWAALTAELDAWLAAGRIAGLWWRDDDAAGLTPALDTLLRLRDELDVPLALAVVPAGFAPELAARIDGAPGVTVLQHGYTHKNFAPAGERKIELDESRPADYVVAELAVGLDSLSRLTNWQPVLVPPWNRIAPHLLPFLPELGYRGLSTIGPRPRRNAQRGLVQNNVHVDIIDWRGRHGGRPGGLAAAPALAMAVEHLAARRSGSADETEATGLMTHHLVHDAAAWAFTRRFVETVRDHPAAEWRDAEQIFGPRA